jgi:hypothetical protein
MKKLLFLSIFLGIQATLMAQTTQKGNKVKLTKAVELQQLALAKQKETDAKKMQKIKSEESKKAETGFSKAVVIQQNAEAKKED